MKKNKLSITLLSLMLALCFLLCFGAVSASAEGEEEAAVNEGEAPQASYVPEEPQPSPGEQTPVPAEIVTEAYVETSAPEREPMYEYIYNYDEDVTSAYEAPQYLADLPEVSASEVVEATAVVIPDVAVSDSSVFSGIVMWLCVALGIAVIVGVMVSKRTRRRGA